MRVDIFDLIEILLYPNLHFFLKLIIYTEVKFYFWFRSTESYNNFRIIFSENIKTSALGKLIFSSGFQNKNMFAFKVVLQLRNLNSTNFFRRLFL